MPGSKKPVPIRKSASCQVYRHSHLNSSSSDTSTSTSSSSDNAFDTPLRRFNRLLRSSVARHWSYFRKDRPDLRSRGRSVSDTGLCGIVDNDPDLAYLDIEAVSPRRSLQAFGKGSSHAVPTLFITSAGGSSSVGAEEASDGSDAERPRKGHHLRVPTPVFHQPKKTMIEGLFAEYSAQKWEHCVNHVINIEDEYCKHDGIRDDAVDFVINTLYDFDESDDGSFESEESSSTDIDMDITD